MDDQYRISRRILIFPVTGMLTTFLLILFCLVAIKLSNVFSVRFRHDGSLTVQVETGVLKGKLITPSDCGHYISFRGIPYAKPPIGDLRFQDPQPPDKWDGVLEASKDGNMCPQMNIKHQKLKGNEDCLFLNVYTRGIPSENFPLSMPVMVWIHGGYFLEGSCSFDEFGPEYLVSEGVVLVTLNYRLGPLGFLYMPGGAPGNAGMKDQVLALKWVQKNIAQFGGNPQKVTIFGHSAGGASVHLHVLSPLSKGLFHRAIAQSASALQSMFLQSAPVETSKRLAAAVSCTNDDAAAAVKCLQKVDVNTLLRAGLFQAPTEKDKKRFIPFPFVPTVDAGDPPFLPLPPLALMNQEKYEPVPYITGFTDGESQLLFKYMNFFNHSVQQFLDQTWHDKIFQDMMPINDSQEAEAVADIRKFYLKNSSLTNDTVYGYLNMLTDTCASEIMFTLCMMEKNAIKKSFTRDKGTGLYLYYFTADNILNSQRAELPVKLPGACHGDDLGYLFRQSNLPVAFIGSKAFSTRQKMVRLWTNFAKYGEPGKYDGKHIWPQYDVEGGNYLEIGNEVQEKTFLNSDRMKFWSDFFDKFGAKHRC